MLLITSGPPSIFAAIISVVNHEAYLWFNCSMFIRPQIGVRCMSHDHRSGHDYILLKIVKWKTASPPVNYCILHAYILIHHLTSHVTWTNAKWMTIDGHAFNRAIHSKLTTSKEQTPGSAGVMPPIYTIVSDRCPIIIPDVEPSRLHITTAVLCKKARRMLI